RRRKRPPNIPWPDRSSSNPKASWIVRPRCTAFAIVLVLAAFAAVACKKKESSAPIKASHVHTITREMLRAAASVVREPGHIESKLDFDGRRNGQVDHIRIAVSAGPSQAQKEMLARLIQALDRVAAANA